MQRQNISGQAKSEKLVGSEAGGPLLTTPVFGALVFSTFVLLYIISKREINKEDSRRSTVTSESDWTENEPHNPGESHGYGK